jgi:pimeloyl-ACP methyl ester carboxylesterase
MRSKSLTWLFVLMLGTSGCGNFVARRMVQAPNSYPSWLAPVPRVQLAFADKFITNFTAQYLNVGPPTARLRYRVVEPADYQCESSSTNWLRRGRPNYRFSFRAVVPGKPNEWTNSPRGTVVLLHGYGVGEFAMSPWALRLAQEGWRCVLLDLRGHGKSTGRRIFFGLQETHDLSQLLDQLGRDRKLAFPVHAIGESYGAAIALRWKATDPRVSSVVAMAPYAHLSNAVVNISHDYAGWLPRGLLNAGLKQLPSLLGIERSELDPVAVLARHSEIVLFVAGSKDEIAPVADVRELHDAAAIGSQLIVVPNATHEALPYFFDELTVPVLSWLREGKLSATTRPDRTTGSVTGRASLEFRTWTE